MKTDSEFHLKRPIFVQLLALGFLLSPFFNMSLTLYREQIGFWYLPTTWYRLFPHLGIQDYLLYGSAILAGSLLFIQRKWAWATAISVIFFSIVHNVVFPVNNEAHPFITTPFLIASNLSVLLIVVHFRFPYLDQRDHIFGRFERMKARLPIEIGGLDETFQTANVSKGGAFILKLSEEKMGNIDLFDFKIDQQLSGKAIVVYSNQFGCGIRFVQRSRSFNRDLKRFLKDIELKSSDKFKKSA